NNTYKINPLGMLAIFIGYCLTLFCSQVIALAVYTFTTGHENRKKAIKAFILGATVIMAGFILIKALPSENFLNSAVRAVDSDFFLYIPIAGWLKMFTIGVISGITSYIYIGLGLTFITVLLLIIFIMKCNADFYEDVLQATERTFSAITAAREGKIADTSPAKIKLGKAGIGKGKGADVFFYKHLLENRRGRFFILDLPAIVFIAACLIFAFIMRKTGVIPIFAFATYMQIFNISMGRWLKELVLPYVYMIPVSPFKKLIAICKESIFKIIIEAIILFIPMTFILSLSLNELIVCIIARVGFGLLLISGNILTERLFGTVINKMIIFSLFFLTIIIIALPGIIAGILAGVFLPTLFISPVTIGFLVTFIWNTLAAAIITFLCRDILNYAELNNK
ncbi:MAG: hypothetical protein K0S55_1801, partial [Clostridia bacterium]|nr:hypothetical protein [Clostridia bacterium]